MSLSTWPTTLPAPNRDNYSNQPKYNVIRTAFDSGWAKTRLRSTAGARSVTLEYHMTVDQRAIFETFYNTTLYGGSLEFYITLPDSSVTSTARFTDAPAEVPDGVEYKITIQLEVKE